MAQKLPSIRLLLPYVIVCLLIILLFPYKTVIVPEWKIQAVNDRGEPLANVTFRQSWDNYTYGMSGGTMYELDGSGYVVLPEHSFYAPLIYRIPRSMLAHMMTMAHGSLGNSSSLNAFTKTCSSEVLFFDESPVLPDEIVLACPRSP